MKLSLRKRLPEAGKEGQALHRTSITEAALLTALAFNTVFRIPPEDGIFTQILGVTIIFGAILWLIEVARDWEERRRKKCEKQNSIQNGGNAA